MRPNVVIDVGSGYTKMGFAGNLEPQYIIPTVVARSTRGDRSVHISKSQGPGIADLDFHIGDDRNERWAPTDFALSCPVQRGRVENWDDMERYMQHTVFRKLRCVPEEHMFLLTETPFNTPENRELMAEIMFETFNINGLHIGVQAVLALYAQWVNLNNENEGKNNEPDLTGLVVDSGDGLTHAIPVADGFVVSSCIQEIPLAGEHVTKFISDMLADRKEPVPTEQRMQAARTIKESHSYICKDVVEEYCKFDKDPRRFKVLHGTHFKTKEPWSIEIGYERFLAPEIFFNPEIFETTVTTPLPVVLDNCIMHCPIDYRRKLYSNIVLSGGSTTFQHFKERLQTELQRNVDKRLQSAESATGASPMPIPVLVHGSAQRRTQRFAAWLGGSYVASEPRFQSLFKTKQEYDEVGPSCMRPSPVLL